MYEAICRWMIFSKILEQDDKSLIGRQFNLLVTSSFLCTGVISASLITSSKSEFIIDLFIISSKTSPQISIYFLRCCADTLFWGFDLFIFKVLTSFTTSGKLTTFKEKESMDLYVISFILSMLEWFVNLNRMASMGSLIFMLSFTNSIGFLMRSDETEFWKNVFKVSATAESFEIISPSSIRHILYLVVPLSVKKGFRVDQNFLLSVILFRFILL